MLTFEKKLPAQVKELHTMLRDVCAEPSWKWLSQALHSIEDASFSQSANAAAINKTCSALLITSAAAKRELGSSPVVIYGQSPTWHSHDIGRLLLLQQFKHCMFRLQQEQWSHSLLKVYRRFGEDEKALLLRSLSLLGGAELLPIALDASRTNDEALYATLALNNPYPGTHFPERNFHQLVLKSLFIDLDIKHIQGLDKRLSPTLSQLCADLVEERRLAHRDIPHSIWHAIRPDDIPEALPTGAAHSNRNTSNTTSTNTTVFNTTGQPSL